MKPFVIEVAKRRNRHGQPVSSNQYRVYELRLSIPITIKELKNAVSEHSLDVMDLLMHMVNWSPIVDHPSKLIPMPREFWAMQFFCEHDYHIYHEWGYYLWRSPALAKDALRQCDRSRHNTWLYPWEMERDSVLWKAFYKYQCYCIDAIMYKLGMTRI